MKEFLKSFNLLTNNELDEVEKYISIRILNKGEFFITEKKICTEVAFIQSGILRSFYNSTDNEEITNCISFENELTSAFSSFITQLPTDENIQAISDSVLLVLTKDDLEMLYKSSATWQEIGRLLTEMQYVELEKRIVSFQKFSAKQRYQELLKHHSKYIQFIPLQYLASYLGITPRHLSRLRREIAF
jgi:CRP-like cAMP-binding protein